RIRGQPLGDLLQPGGQPVLGAGLTLAPLAVFIPDRPPPVALLPGRVHRDPALQLNHHTTVAARGRAPGSAREDLAASRPACGRPAGTGGLRTGRLWGFCGDLRPYGRCLRHGYPSLPAFMQVRGLRPFRDVEPVSGFEPLTSVYKTA